MGQTHFRGLNYTLANEDNFFEYSMLEEGLSHILSIAGSGGRVVPLLARRPKVLTCVDLSQEQLFLTEYRIQSLKDLTYEEYLEFWGFLPDEAIAPPRGRTRRRRLLFEKIRGLSPPARSFMFQLLESSSWGPPLYEGKWERTAHKVSRASRKFVGNAGRELLECNSLEEQRAYLNRTSRSGFPWSRWNAFLFLYTGLLATVWRIKPQVFPVKNVKESFFKIYSGSLEKMLRNTLFRENFMLHMTFFGRIVDPRAYPVECDRVVFEQAKKAAQLTQVNYRRGEILQTVRSGLSPIDFISFSNAPSYFPPELGRSYLGDLWEFLSERGTVVVRNFLHNPDSINLKGYTEDSASFVQAAQKERTQSYDIRVYRKAAAV